jgi:MFS family permease
LFVPELAKLNIGIFILHAIFTASFVVIPISLLHFLSLETDQQWLLYLPTFLVAFVIVLFCIGLAERNHKLKPFFLISIFSLIIALLLLWLSPHNIALTAVGLCLFFAGFSLLEAFLPSLISRTAPAARKGSALGIYSCSQFLGIFVGGVLGGWLYGKFSYSGVYIFCVLIALFWFVLAFLMQPPHYLVTQMWHVLPSKRHDWDKMVTKLQIIPGMMEVTFIAEEGMAYLKMERSTITHPDFIHLKEHLIGITV